jgi:hypothetical protein
MAAALALKLNARLSELLAAGLLPRPDSGAGAAVLPSATFAAVWPPALSGPLANSSVCACRQVGLRAEGRRKLLAF